MNTTTENPNAVIAAAKCANRIGQEMAERENQLREMTEREGEYYGDEESLYEFALSVDTIKFTKVCLSYGGPADYLEIEWTETHGIESVTYRFSDWFDTATERVEEGSYLYQYATMIIEGEMNL